MPHFIAYREPSEPPPCVLNSTERSTCSYMSSKIRSRSIPRIVPDPRAGQRPLGGSEVEVPLSAAVPIKIKIVCLSMRNACQGYGGAVSRGRRLEAELTGSHQHWPRVCSSPCGQCWKGSVWRKSPRHRGQSIYLTKWSEQCNAPCR